MFDYLNKSTIRTRSVRIYIVIWDNDAVFNSLLNSTFVPLFEQTDNLHQTSRMHQLSEIRAFHRTIRIFIKSIWYLVLLTRRTRYHMKNKTVGLCSKILISLLTTTFTCDFFDIVCQNNLKNHSSPLYKHVVVTAPKSSIVIINSIITLKH